MFTTGQFLLFLALIVMGLIWFWMIRGLQRQLAERHPETYTRLGLDGLFPSRSDWHVRTRGLNVTATSSNASAVFALFRFLFGRQDKALNDPSITTLTLIMRRWLYLFIVVFCGLLYSFAMSAQQQEEVAKGVTVSDAPTEKKNEAYRLYNEGRHAEAITLFDELLEAPVKDTEILYWRGMAHWQAGDEEAALEDLREVTYLDHDHYEAFVKVDQLLAPQDRWSEILGAWDRYIRANPDDPRAYLERSGTHFHGGNLAAARSDADDACELGLSRACNIAEQLRQ